MSMTKHYLDSISIADSNHMAYSMNNSGLSINTSPGWNIIDPEKQKRDVLIKAGWVMTQMRTTTFKELIKEFTLDDVDKATLALEGHKLEVEQELFAIKAAVTNTSTMEENEKLLHKVEVACTEDLLKLKLKKVENRIVLIDTMVNNTPW